MGVVGDPFGVDAAAFQQFAEQSAELNRTFVDRLQAALSKNCVA